MSGRLERGLLVALLAAALLGDPAGRAAVAQERGKIDGRVVNGTAGAPPPAGLAITVHAFEGRTKVSERTVQSDERGGFSVDGLATGKGYVYFPIVDYGGVGYWPERPVTLEDDTEKQIEIRVFEPTQAQDVIQVDRANLLLLGVSPTELTIMEMGAVVNGSDRAYVGDTSADPRRPTLRFSLPQGADQITPQAGLTQGELLPTQDGFMTTDPVLPGRHDLAFSYQLPIDAPGLDLVKLHQYPTASFNLYVPDTGIAVLSPQLTFQGTSEFSGQRFQLYTATSLPAGSQVAARLTGLPSRGGLGPRELGFIVVGSGAIVLGIGGLLALRRGRGTRAGPREPRTEAPTAERLQLVRALAALDERFSAGEIDEEQYRQERARGKERLVALSAASTRGP